MFKIISAHELSEAVLKSMSDGVFAVDCEKRIVLANSAVEKMFSVKEAEILGKTVRESIHNNEIADLVEEAMRLNREIEKEINIVIPFVGSFSAVANPLTNYGGVVCVLHNITEIRKLENYRSEFVTNVSHELKTPLTAISNYVETLLGGAIDDKSHNREFLEKVEKHTIALSSLIDDILQISQLESKKDFGPTVKIDLVEISMKACEMLAEKAKRKSVEIIMNQQDDFCVISGNEDQAYRAVLNILDNAVNYTEKGGSVTIVCRAKDNSVELSIIDTGIGIPKNDVPRLFERFYRVDKARSRDLGGTGLGLSIVKHIMNLHNGSVSVESEEGKGSTFTLIFPLQ